MYSTFLKTQSDAIKVYLSQIGIATHHYDYPWNNITWTSKLFRSAHLEEFYTDKVSVLHCVVMPKVDTDAPIYGFDVIEINGNLTGMFLDVTPTVSKYNIDIPQVGEPREIPDWADFFSEQFVCSKPNESDVAVGVDVLKKYISKLPGNKGNSFLAQQRYVEGQRKNPQTFRMLKSHIGEERANTFIYDLLFPDVIG